MEGQGREGRKEKKKRKESKERKKHESQSCLVVVHFQRLYFVSIWPLEVILLDGSLRFCVPESSCEHSGTKPKTHPVLV